MGKFSDYKVNAVDWVLAHKSGAAIILVVVVVAIAIIANEVR